MYRRFSTTGFGFKIGQSLNRRLAEQWIDVPDFSDEPTIIIGSDYAGDSKNSRYRIYSFYIIGQSKYLIWRDQILELRRKILGNRVIAYKNLGDNVRMRSLSHYIDICRNHRGWLLNVAIEKTVDITPRKGEYPDHDDFSFHTRNISTFRRTFEILSILGVAISGVTVGLQNIIWITDDDQIIPNDEAHIKLANLFGRFISIYCDHTLGHIKVASSRQDDGGLSIEDILSLPDLVAGSLNDFLGTNQEKRKIARLPLVIPMPEKCKHKAKLIFHCSTANRPYSGMSPMSYQEVGRIIPLACFTK